jgi:hypothetical protein
MKCSGKTVICLLGSFALATGVQAVVNEEAADNTADNASGNPYKVIVERNVFDLRPPPPPVSQQATNTPPPNIKLTGITTILGKKQALFMVQEPAPPGKPANKEESYILTEGQRQGVIEVIEINEKDFKVRIKNDGNISLLTFETVKLPNAAAGAPPSPAGGIPHPNFITPQAANAYQPATYNPNATAGAAAANPGNGLSQIPLRSVRPTTPTQPTQELSREEQIIMMEAQREANKNNPNFPPLPPTPLTPGNDTPAPPSPTVPRRPGLSLPPPPGVPNGNR